MTNRISNIPEGANAEIAHAVAKLQEVIDQPINVLAIVKGDERYIFLFDDYHRADTLRTLGRFAANEELSLTWYDAAVLSQRIRKMTS